MSALRTELTIPKSEFTAASVVNEIIFAQEIRAAGLSVPLDYMTEVAGSIVAYFTGVASAADVSALEALKLAHTGGQFASDSQRATANPVVSAPNTTEVTLVTLRTGKLPAGDYDLQWYAEHRTTDVTADSLIRVYATKNNGAMTEIGMNSTNGLSYNSFAGPYPVNLVDGDSVTVEIRLARGATGSGSAQARRARLFFKRDTSR